MSKSVCVNMTELTEPVTEVWIPDHIKNTARYPRICTYL
jgi:hypothetical protein